ncbi:NACHT domain-containing protein [Kitasatospora sp. NPDC058965]|uniref:NACHT domain-containing protein n=1 Tax=Kitasatospora sp. NPDC058965 TaxID=3346682 RepID=UPI0036AA8DCA
MDYNLSALGPREFEHLSQSLAKCVLGPGVSVFGDGKDGGREATFRGPVTYPHEGQAWDGYGVVQAKYRQRENQRVPDTLWMERAITGELQQWAASTSRRGDLPEYMLFTSNVVLSPVPGTGGIDRVRAHIAAEAKRLKIRLKGWDVWHYDEICRYLEMYPGVRQSYAGFITPGDVLSRLLDVLPDATAETADMIRIHAAMDLMADQWVRLGQAGSEASGKIGLGPVAVDLEARLTGNDPEFVRAGEYAIERGDSIMRPSLQTAEDPRHILVIGGPGQGKSTLGQLICQAYRVALLDEEGEHLLTGEAREALRTLRRDLDEISFPKPRARRWPLRIALHDYANAILGGEELSLLHFLAQKVEKRAPGVKAATLSRWLRTWPSVIVLDGLDEVASTHMRDLVMTRISEFLTYARGLDADLFVVGTTRPQGYKGEFHRGDYETVMLTEMSLADALHYADRLVKARHHDDPDMHEEVGRRVAEASRETATTRLMRSPLQVTIMSLLVEKHARMPQNRFELFDAYYNTIYEREVGKPNETGRLLAENRQHVDWLHQYVGVLLQTRAAQYGRRDAVMDQEELKQRLEERLVEETDDPQRASTLGAKLIAAATDRLVLLVAPELGQIGFEVRSLQEYSAARALISGPDDAIIPRLETLARHPSWRNTWLLAAAGVFTKHAHLRGELVGALRTLDAQDEASMLLLPGAKLALSLLDDDLARQHPRYQNLLVQHAAELIAQCYTGDYRVLAGVLIDAAGRHTQAQAHLLRAAKDAASSRGRRLLYACQVLACWAKVPGSLGLAARQLLSSAVQHMTPTERAAARLCSADRNWAVPVPGLPTYKATSDVRTTLGAFITADESAPAVHSFIKGLRSITVFLQKIDGVTVPYCESRMRVNTTLFRNRAAGAEVRRSCLAAVEAQDETGWQIAMVFADMLANLVDVVAPEPTIRGIN